MKIENKFRKYFAYAMIPGCLLMSGTCVRAEEVRKKSEFYLIRMTKCSWAAAGVGDNADPGRRKSDSVFH